MRAVACAGRCEPGGRSPCGRMPRLPVAGGRVTGEYSCAPRDGWGNRTGRAGSTSAVSSVVEVDLGCGSSNHHVHGCLACLPAGQAASCRLDRRECNGSGSEGGGSVREGGNSGEAHAGGSSRRARGEYGTAEGEDPDAGSGRRDLLASRSKRGMRYEATNL